MKPHWTLLLVAAWLGAPAFAQKEAAEKPRARVGPQAQRANRQQTRASGYQARIDYLRKELKLDEGQQEEFDRIAAEYLEQRPSDTDRQRQQELVDEMRTARNENDSDRVRELQTELRSTRTGRPMFEFYGQVEPILNEEQLETLGEIRARAATERGRGRGPLAQLDRLRAQLNLNEEQAKQYDELYANLEEEIAQAKSDTTEISELLQEIRKAVDEGDDARLKELKEQLPNARDKADKLIADFLNEVESFLEPKQKETLERFKLERNRGRSRADLRECFAFVDRLDLDQEQRQTLREIKRDSRQAERKARRDPAARRELLELVQQQLRDMLNDEQVAEFDRWLEGQKSPESGRGARSERRDRRAEKTDKP